jgi:hypothetical protein
MLIPAVRGESPLSLATDCAARRDFYHGLLGQPGDQPDPAAEIPPDSESELRSKRREVMKRVSDEALLELDRQALFLMAKRKARPPG